MQEEISLRELIEVIIKGKKLIIATTIIALLIAAIFSYLVIKPTYETTATILVNNNSLQQQGAEELNSYLNEVVSPQVYSQRLKSQQLLKRVVDKHNLEWNVKSLQRNLNVETEKESKIITITLKGNDPELIHKTLNAIIAESKLYVGETISSRLTAVAEQYKGQLAEEKKNLDKALKAYNDAQFEQGLPTLVLLDALTNEEKQYLLDVDEKYLEELQELDKNKQVEFQKLNNQVNSLTELYNKYSNKYEEARSLSKLFNLESVLTIVSEPELPDHSVSPNKTVNMAIALVIGLMVSVAIVFSRHYWKETNKGS
ncbi:MULTISPECIES: Wzz/FepE/Etk N-terminal domain-containing protein [unclassified Mesobacillus]|uniref:Wzz/FepE/Etk N-terminal domain-containing protein n=1 Tax=unclassified Mesobacillus TaxID=2675270 RepID=UPI00203BB769|nr:MULTISPECIES: Wzz/FepE/Etk N-terminal domain-containing protein [unclassified Mesobacillus]MCM3124176.1 Wzz/FepE/Etk N-terminal domain-containing protein [Mesobacillus sp. MER 33]MCM3234025.1 Wzz/FepE/Etk N-terminal domain-containing protein [Mesobacillus sp. MER 48]